MPNVPSFASRAESSIVTPTGPRCTPTGSHVWNGQTGTFTMNPAISATNSQNWVVCFAASSLGLAAQEAANAVIQAHLHVRPSGPAART